jgi:hypothetical protein
MEKPAARKPLALEEIEKLLRGRGHITAKKVATLVEQYGVSFELTDAIEKELRKLGADDRLLLVITRKRVQPAPTAAPQSVFTWTDPATKLMWAGQDNGSDVNWTRAKDYCATLQLGGYSNWRLATIDELAGIYDPAQNVGDCHIKGSIRFHGYCWSWSSSVVSPLKEAWYFSFHGGQRGSSLLDNTDFIRVLCVRRSGE